METRLIPKFGMTFYYQKDLDHMPKAINTIFTRSNNTINTISLCTKTKLKMKHTSLSLPNTSLTGGEDLSICSESI